MGRAGAGAGAGRGNGRGRVRQDEAGRGRGRGRVGLRVQLWRPRDPSKHSPTSPHDSNIAACTRNGLMAVAPLPVALLGLDPLFWTHVKLFIADVHRLTAHPDVAGSRRRLLRTRECCVPLTTPDRKRAGATRLRRVLRREPPAAKGVRARAGRGARPPREEARVCR